MRLASGFRPNPLESLQRSTDAMAEIKERDKEEGRGLEVWKRESGRRRGGPGREGREWKWTGREAREERTGKGGCEILRNPIAKSCIKPLQRGV